jgi:hypothetical protein
MHSGVLVRDIHTLRCLALLFLFYVFQVRFDAGTEPIHIRQFLPRQGLTQATLEGLRNYGVELGNRHIHKYL